MELRHLRYFLALADILNFTRAAERLHITQSTLSHQINQLEEEIGKKLFDRNGRRVVLSEAGESFLVYASRAMAEIDKGLGNLKQNAVPLNGSVRVGATPTANQQLLPACIIKFVQDHPTVKVIVDELSGDEIANRLLGQTLDIGISYRPGEKEGLSFEPLFNDALVLVVSKEHPLAKRKRVRIAELHCEDLVLLPSLYSTRRLLNECFHVAGAIPNVVAEMNSVTAMLALVSATRIGAIVGKGAMSENNTHLRVIALEGPVPTRIHGLIFSQAHELSPASVAFSVLIRRQALLNNN